MTKLPTYKTEGELEADRFADLHAANREMNRYHYETMAGDIVIGLAVCAFMRYMGWI